ncbi:MAG: hypothetical protein WC284_18025, partial [Candidimonas sp.]
MSVSYSDVAERLYEILKGRSYTVVMFDNNGSRVYDAANARWFYCGHKTSKPTKVMVNLNINGDYDSINVHISKTTSIKKIQKLLMDLRHTSSHYGL